MFNLVMLGCLVIFILVMRGLVGGSGKYVLAYPSRVTRVCAWSFHFSALARLLPYLFLILPSLLDSGCLYHVQGQKVLYLEYY